jgi:hypothetical protein
MDPTLDGVETLNTSGSRSYPLWLPFLLIAAFLVSMGTWSLHAPRFFSWGEASYGSHWSHSPWMLIHVLGATVALVVGPWMLWSGLRQRNLAIHMWVGRTYLICGAIGVSGGMIMSVMAPHDPRGLFVATFTLGVVWFAVAILGYRAIRSYRIETHRDLMILSYVLTFTFVNCRLVTRLPLLESLGVEKDAALVWLGWTIPFLMTLLALHLKKPARTS